MEIERKREGDQKEERRRSKGGGTKKKAGGTKIDRMRQGSIKEDSNGDFRNFFSYFAFSSSILLLFSVFMQSLIFSILEFMRFVKTGIYCNINNIVKYEGFSCISIYFTTTPIQSS